MSDQPDGRIVYRPRDDEHACEPRFIGLPPSERDYPVGTVYKCRHCDTTWVSQGITGGGHQRTGGYASGALTWKRESKRARRKRERQGITPEQLWPDDYFSFSPLRPATACPAQQPADPAE